MSRLLIVGMTVGLFLIADACEAQIIRRGRFFSGGVVDQYRGEPQRTGNFGFNNGQYTDADSMMFQQRRNFGQFQQPQFGQQPNYQGLPSVSPTTQLRPQFQQPTHTQQRQQLQPRQQYQQPQVRGYVAPGAAPVQRQSSANRQGMQNSGAQNQNSQRRMTPTPTQRLPGARPYAATVPSQIQPRYRINQFGKRVMIQPTLQSAPILNNQEPIYSSAARTAQASPSSKSIPQIEQRVVAPIAADEPAPNFAPLLEGPSDSPVDSAASASGAHSVLEK